MEKTKKLVLDPKYSTLQEYFSSPSTCQWTSDVTIYCEDGSYFAHKLVLSSLSNLLKSLFLETSCDINVSLILPDFSEEEVSSFIKNVYAGNSSGSFSSLRKSLGISRTRSQVASVDKTEYSEVKEGSTENTDAEKEKAIYARKNSNPRRIQNHKKQVRSRSYVKRVQRSPIWDHFNKTSSNNYLKCTYCDKTVSATNGGTSGAKRHVLNFHRDKLSEIQMQDFRHRNVVVPQIGKV